MPFYEDSDLETESPSNEAPPIIAPWSQPGVKAITPANFNISPAQGQVAPNNIPAEIAGVADEMARLQTNYVDHPPSLTARGTLLGDPAVVTVTDDKVKAPKKVDTRDIEYQKALEEYEIKCKQHEADLQAATDALDEAMDQYDDGKEQMRRQQYDWEKQWKDHLKTMKAKIAELKKVKITPPKK